MTVPVNTTAAIPDKVKVTKSAAASYKKRAKRSFAQFMTRQTS